jgi:hypothetical protein
MKSEVIETKGARLWLGEDGIFRSVTKPNAEISLEQARQLLEAHKKITGSKKTPVFTDIRMIKSMSRAARVQLAGKEAEKIHSALAILTNSPLNKLFGNLFMSFNKPRFPTRIFTSEEEAIGWLKGFINKEEF